MASVRNSAFFIAGVVLSLNRWLPAQDEVVIDQAMISTATITERKWIDFFINSYLIPESEVERIVFIDATGNGFGEEDLIKCFPSEKTYYLFPSDSAQKIMNSWEFSSNFQSVTQNKAPEVFEELQTDRAQNWILAGLLHSLNRNYADLPMKMYFERDSTTMVFELWGYTEPALRWRPPPPPPSVPETTYDLLHVLRSDTLFVSDTTYYDQFFIYRNVVDTVFMSNEDLIEREKKSDGIYQPGLVPVSAGKRE
jgi:hypothetical protein